MVKVKLCGNRTIEDVEATAGAEAQGFIVWTSSPREVEPETAAELMAFVPPFNSAVLVTRLADPLLLGELVEVLEPDALQLHQELSPVQIDRIRRALPIRVALVALLAVTDEPDRCLQQAERLAESPLDGLLLDTQLEGLSGGTGVPHDWELSARICDALAPLPVILAGGITPDNVEEAIKTVRPYAIDVSSGVETEGRKDPAKVRALLTKVRRCEP